MVIEFSFGDKNGIFGCVSADGGVVNMGWFRFRVGSKKNAYIVSGFSGVIRCKARIKSWCM